MSEEDIFGNPDLMPKLSAALKTITKRKRVKGKPLVEVIATVQRDGSLPACVQTSGGSASASSTALSQSLGRSASAGNVTARPGARRGARPPSLLDAIATSPEEYAANMAQAYGSVNRPGSSASARQSSVSPALSNIGNGGVSEDHARVGWGHNSAAFAGSQGQQWRRQGTSSGTRVLPQGPPLSAPAHHGRGGVFTFGAEDRSASREAGGYLQEPLPLQESLLDSPASSCTTLVAGTSPGGGDRFSPGGSLAGGFSPATKKSNSPTPAEQAARHSRMARVGNVQQVGDGVEATVGAVIMPDGARSAPAAGASRHRSAARVSHWGQNQTPSVLPQHQRPKKRLSTTSSLASTDVESLDTSHLLEFDDDDEDEPSCGSQQAGDGGFGVGPSATSAHRAATGGGSTAGVSPEDLQELEDALLMESFSVMEELLEGEDIAGPFPDLNSNGTFPDLQTVGASLPPLPRGTSGQRGTPRSSAAGGAGSPQLFGQQMFGGASPNNHAGSASPSNGAGSTNGFSLLGSSSGPPRPGLRGTGRARHQVPPRPYTPNKSSRGGNVPWLSTGLGGGISPRVGSSPRPPTTPQGSSSAAGGRLGSGHGQGRAGTGPSPKARRRGEEAFLDFGLASSNEQAVAAAAAAAAHGAPSPKARRLGPRAFPERFPGSPSAGLSPRVGFPPQSPRSSGLVGAASPLDGSGNDRTYFPAPAANAALLTTSPANGSSRSHRRTSSNDWGSPPLQGGGGDGGVLCQGWGGDSPSNAGKTAGASRRASTGVAKVSDVGLPSSVGGVLSSLPSGDSGLRWNGRTNNNVNVNGNGNGNGNGNTQNNNAAVGDVVAAQAAAAVAAQRANKGQQLRRRHSAPVPQIPQQSQSPAWNVQRATTQVKDEFFGGMVPSENVDGRQSSDVNADGTTGWMLDEFAGAPAVPPPTAAAGDQDDAWWPPVTRASGGGMGLEQPGIMSNFEEAVV